ncbi:MAG: FAD:protein FMN transferase [Oscillospiraceae bacterium]|nr:FAD:protein FMN transferase [Oscillospiraceae bacterium]
MKKFLLIFCLVFTLSIVGCVRSTEPEKITQTIFVMDTFASITVFDNSDEAEAAIVRAFERLYEIEETFNYYDPDSELSWLNRMAFYEPVTMSEDMNVLATLGVRYSEMTGGAFDVSIGKLIELWEREDTLSPSQKEIDELLPYLGWNNIVFGVCQDGVSTTIRFLNEHVQLHFGAIAKGWAVDVIMWQLQNDGVTSALIDIGGEIGVLGDAPRESGLWHVQINDPFGDLEFITYVKVKGGTRVATSGTYERGEHILNPKTGYPADKGLVSVTVIGLSGNSADAFSTAIFVFGAGEIRNIIDRGGCVVTIDEERRFADYHFDGCDCGDSVEFINRLDVVK